MASINASAVHHGGAIPTAIIIPQAAKKNPLRAAN